jgi:hypothetical protein
MSSSLYNSRNWALTRYCLFFEAPSIALKIKSIALGTIPRKCSGDYDPILIISTTFHCKCFACTRLTISKNSSIITLQHALNNRLRWLLKYSLLFRCLTVCSIKCKFSCGILITYISEIITLLWMGILNRNHTSRFINIYHIKVTSLHLLTT